MFEMTDAPNAHLAIVSESRRDLFFTCSGSCEGLKLKAAAFTGGKGLFKL